MRRGFLNGKSAAKREPGIEKAKEPKADLAKATQKPPTISNGAASAKSETTSQHATQLVIDTQRRILDAFDAKPEERAVLRKKYNLEETNPRVVKLSLMPGMALYLRNGDTEGSSIRLATLPPPKFANVYNDLLEQYTFCLFWPYVRETLSAFPEFPMALASTDVSRSRPYAIKSSPAGGGNGVFARRSLVPGDLIIAERPLMLIPEAQLVANDGSVGHPNTVLEAVVNRAMVDDNRTLYHSLHNCKPVTSEYTKLRGILDTNGLPAGEAFPGPHEGIRYACVARDISRVNHSCSPNAQYRFDRASLSCELRALWPIKEGEEICITYVNTTAKRSERQSALKNKYGFQCKCIACDKPRKASERADRERGRLHGIYEREVKQKDYSIALQEVQKWAQDPAQPSDLLVKKFLGVIEAMSREQFGESGLLARFSMLLCTTYLALGNLVEARRWAKESYRMLVVDEGELSASVNKNDYDRPEETKILGRFWRMRASAS